MHLKLYLCSDINIVLPILIGASIYYFAIEFLHPWGKFQASLTGLPTSPKKTEASVPRTPTAIEDDNTFAPLLKNPPGKNKQVLPRQSNISLTPSHREAKKSLPPVGK